MHIPDGYLSPATCGVLYAVSVPLWAVAARKVRDFLRSEGVGLLALGAAFSFVVMMFNIPLPGGTTGHVTGGALLTLVLGPWIASISLSICLVIQALVFGDGGLSTLGANVLNIAFITTFTAHLVNTLPVGRKAEGKKLFVKAGVAGYLSVVVASLFVGIELGLQPIIAHTPAGEPLYCPYPLHVTVPVMLLSHLLFIGIIEGAVTGAIVLYLKKTMPELFLPGKDAGEAEAGSRDLDAGGR
jgi:cobalt/nickel transport system permease protein